MSQNIDKVNNALNQIGDLMDDGFLLVDKHGNIEFANSSAEEFLGKELSRRNVTEVIKSKDLNISRFLKTDKEIDKEFSFQMDDDVKRSLSIKIKKLSNELVVILLLDMTLQRNLEKVRRDFVSNVSHELRSPLTSLVGFIETLLSDKAIDIKSRHKFLKIMDEEAKRMNRLIDDILSLSKVETEEHITPSTSISILDPIKSVISSLDESGLSKNNKISLVDKTLNEDRPLYIIGNYDEITQVFTNLFENAIKYGFEKSDIFVNITKPNGKEVVVEVINEGEGIPTKYLERLTERFFRVDKARSRKIGGTGLGLAIVKHILIRHRASLTIDSELNKKTSFKIKFPLIKH
tara:strand:+ start:208 stop:1254 length:1047 start_codon:yes stop_codon:yes gene_type:complete